MHPILDWKFAWICTFGTQIGRQTDPFPFADRIEFLVDIEHLQSTKRSFSALRGMPDGRQTSRICFGVSFRSRDPDFCKSTVVKG
jgi:hypothetical protein